MSVGTIAEGLRPRELTKLTAFQLGEELEKIDQDTATLAQAAIDADRAATEAECRLDVDPKSLDAKLQMKVNKAAYRAAKLQLTQLSRRQSRINKLLDSFGH